MNLTIQQKILIASLICILNLISLIYSIITKNIYLTAYLLGFSSFSTYFLQQQVKEIKKMQEKVISSIRGENKWKSG